MLNNAADKKIFTYIQSRYYRAPEVILEIGYDRKIDIWSFACVVAELSIGKPIFCGKDEIDQLMCMMEIFGIPPAYMIENSPKRQQVVERLRKIMVSPSNKMRVPESRPLGSILNHNDPSFVEFLNSNS